MKYSNGSSKSPCLEAGEDGSVLGWEWASQHLCFHQIIVFYNSISEFCSSLSFIHLTNTKCAELWEYHSEQCKWGLCPHKPYMKGTDSKQKNGCCGTNRGSHHDRRGHTSYSSLSKRNEPVLRKVPVLTLSTDCWCDLGQVTISELIFLICERKGFG